MDFWTFAKYAAKNVRVTLKDGSTHSGFLYTQKFPEEDKYPKRVLEFTLMDKEYNRIRIVCDQIKEIEVEG